MESSFENAFAREGRIGQPLDRTEGRAKVTGTARYAAEYNLPGVAYGVLVLSTIAKGRIKRLDTKAAEKAPGVLAVLSHRNAPKVPGHQGGVNNHGSRVEGQEFRLFYDDKIHHNLQPVALAIAKTFEQADYAASLVKVQYEAEPHQTDLHQNLPKGYKPKRTEDHVRGEVNAYQKAPVRVEAHYHTPIQVHHPMEMHASTAAWEGEDKVTVYNKTQAVKISQQEIAKAFALKEENVHCVSPFVGGAFGSSSRVWPQEMAAILGAKKVGRPVKVMAKRDQVFNMVGYRPESVQKVGIGATRDGQLIGITHEAYGMSSAYEQFTERIVDPTKTMYQCPNLNTVYRLVPLDVSTPCWTRGPGETSGSFALESAVDELAYALQMDPLALRMKNYAEKNPEDGKPWSSKFLKECYEEGARRFGWSRRNPAPRSMQREGMLIGMGMASGIYKSERSPASASVTLRADGTAVVRSSVADVGPGSATIMRQIAADTLALDIDKVAFQWGDSLFPPAPGQFGSHTTASVGSAVHDACAALKEKLAELVVRQEGAAAGQVPAGELVFEEGAVKGKGSAAGLSYAAILKGHQLPELAVTRESKGGPEAETYSGKSFCANFVEVEVHPATGMVRVSRVVSVVDAGRIMNHKTARSQVLGSVVWGIGLALMEEAVIDHRYGRHVNKDLAEYHLPVSADVPPIEVVLLDKKDPVLNPMGAKGLGEIPLVGFTAAVANAVFHATGKRIRQLPITLDKLL